MRSGPFARGVPLSRIGEATLVIQISDSQSRAVLARVVDRRAADPVVAQRSSTPFNMSEVRRMLRRWATQLREGLDNLSEHTPS